MELRIELYMLPGTSKSKTNFLSDHLDRRFLELLAFFFVFVFFLFFKGLYQLLKRKNIVERELAS